MNVVILGTSSGNENVVGRRHASVLIEVKNRLYLFDAGDSCGYTAHTLGFDVTEIRNIFISHPHFDHIGGLAYLLFLMQKQNRLLNKEFDSPIHIYSPASEPIAAARLMLAYSSAPILSNLICHTVEDGFLFDDGILRVDARHNGHLMDEKEPWHSFSFRLASEGKSVLYAGDTRSLSELDGWYDSDLIIIGTGHDDPVDTARYIATHGNPGKVIFTHHGERMLTEGADCMKKACAILGVDIAVMAQDGMTEQL